MKELALTFKLYDEALRENRLLGLKCPKCGAVTTPPRAACSRCGEIELERVELSGTGEVVSFTNIFVPPEGREHDTPYTVTLVKLDEGPHIIGRLDTLCPDKVGMDIIGKRVKLGHFIYGGDKYSAGPAAAPLFKLIV